MCYIFDCWLLRIKMTRGGRREGAGRKADPDTASRRAYSTTIRVNVADKQLLMNIRDLALSQWTNPERAAEIAGNLVRVWAVEQKELYQDFDLQPTKLKYKTPHPILSKTYKII